MRTRLVILAIAAAALAVSAAAQEPAASSSPAPDPNAAPLEISAELGGVVTVTGDAGASVSPTGFVDVDGPVPLGHRSLARVFARLGLTSEPGQAINLVDVRTYRAAEIGLGLRRVVGQLDDVTTSLVVEASFSSRMKGASDLQPRDHLARSFGVGLAFASKVGAALTLEGGLDDATGDGFAFMAYGRAPLPMLAGTFVIVGDISVAIGARDPWLPRRDVARLGVVARPPKKKS